MALAIMIKALWHKSDLNVMVNLGGTLMRRSEMSCFLDLRDNEGKVTHYEEEERQRKSEKKK